MGSCRFAVDHCQDSHSIERAEQTAASEGVSLPSRTTASVSSRKSLAFLRLGHKSQESLARQTACISLAKLSSLSHAM